MTKTTDGAFAPSRLHPSHLETVAPSLSHEALLRLAACSRLRRRFLAALPPLVAERTAPETSGKAEALALLPAERIAEAGLMMGAVWHARPIGRCIGSEAVDTLDAGIGRNARIFGLRAASLGVAPAEPVIAEALVEAVRANGLRCLVCWRDGLAEPFRALATLKLPRDALPKPAAAAAADPIIAEVLECVVHAE